MIFDNEKNIYNFEDYVKSIYRYIESYSVGDIISFHNPEIQSHLEKQEEHALKFISENNKDNFSVYSGVIWSYELMGNFDKASELCHKFDELYNINERGRSLTLYVNCMHADIQNLGKNEASTNINIYLKDLIKISSNFNYPKRMLSMRF